MAAHPVRKSLLGFSGLVAVMLAMPGVAGAAVRYKTCTTTLEGTHVVVQAKRHGSCPRAEAIATHGMHVDGDDGARFRMFGRSWQCVTIARPNHAKWTLFGCFTPYAPYEANPPSKPKPGPAVVKVEIFAPAD